MREMTTIFKGSILLQILLSSTAANAAITTDSIIYGTDNRKDTIELKNGALIEASKAVAARIDRWSYKNINNTSNLIEEMTPADTQTMNTNYNNYKDTFDTLYNETLNQLFVWNQKTNQLLLINSPSNSSDSYNADSDNLTNDRKTFYRRC